MIDFQDCQLMLLIWELYIAAEEKQHNYC